MRDRHHYGVSRPPQTTDSALGSPAFLLWPEGVVMSDDRRVNMPCLWNRQDRCRPGVSCCLVGPEDLYDAECGDFEDHHPSLGS